MIMKMIAIIIGLTLLAVYAYMDFFGTLSFVLGALWGLVNVYFIKELLYELLIANPKNFIKITLTMAFKFPILYGIGFLVLYYQDEFALPMLIGFTISLAMITQKWLWKALQPLGKSGAV